MAAKKPASEGPVEVPEYISILPLRNSVLFPGSIIPIDVGRRVNDLRCTDWENVA